jgi:Tol biopolymer transport system component
VIPYDKLGEGKLVFQRIGPPVNAYSGIYVVDISQQKVWGISDGDLDGPAVSPDGQKIVFTTYASDETAYDVHVMGIDGAYRERVSNIRGQEHFPCWTPDGNKILYLAIHFDSYVTGIYRQSPVQDPLDRELIINYYELDPTYDPSPQDGSISVSPGGKIAVSSFYGVFTFNPDGSNRTYIIESTLDDHHYSAAWSPDGNLLAVLEIQWDEGGIQSLAFLVYDPGGANSDTLVSMPASGNQMWLGDRSYCLCWSPDGSQIAFTRPDDQDVGSHIYTIKTDRTGLTQITSAAGVTDRSLSWGE